MNFIGKNQANFRKVFDICDMPEEEVVIRGRHASAKGWNGPSGMELLKMARKHDIDEVTSESDTKWKACNAELDNGRAISANRDHLKDMCSGNSTV